MRRQSFWILLAVLAAVVLVFGAVICATRSRAVETESIEQVEVIEVSEVVEKEIEPPRPGTWKHMPFLIGKSRSEVMGILGQPDDTCDFRDLVGSRISLTWYYAGEGVVVRSAWRALPGERLTIGLGRSGTSVEFIEYRAPEEEKPFIKDLLPTSLLNKQPDFKVVFVDQNLFGIQFLMRKTGENLVREGVMAPKGDMIEIVGRTDFPPCVQSRVFDENLGAYKTAYSVALTDWLNQRVDSYKQRTGKIMIGIGSEYLGKVPGWGLTR